MKKIKEISIVLPLSLSILFPTSLKQKKEPIYVASSHNQKFCQIAERRFKEVNVENRIFNAGVYN